MPRIIVYHSYYGCDTGCCGHTIEIEQTEPNEKLPEIRGRDFNFDHPRGEDHRKWAEKWVRNKFGEEHVKDLDWDNCVIEEN